MCQKPRRKKQSNGDIVSKAPLSRGQATRRIETISKKSGTAAGVGRWWQEALGGLVSQGGKGGVQRNTRFSATSSRDPCDREQGLRTRKSSPFIDQGPLLAGWVAVADPDPVHRYPERACRGVKRKPQHCHGRYASSDLKIVAWPALDYGPRS